MNKCENDSSEKEVEDEPNSSETEINTDDLEYIEEWNLCDY